MSDTRYCPIEPGRTCGRGCTSTCLADVENQAVGDGARTAETTTVARRPVADELAEVHRRLAEPVDGYQSGYAYARARYGISTRHEAALLYLELNGVLDQPQGLSLPGRARWDRFTGDAGRRPLTGRGDFPRHGGSGELPPAAVYDYLANKYPHPSGDVTVLGPEVFASDDAAVVCWRGENYVRQEEARGLHDALDRINRLVGNAATLDEETTGEVRGLFLDALRDWHRTYPRPRAGRDDVVVGQPSERPDDAAPGVQLDGQGLPPAADTTPGGTA